MELELRTEYGTVLVPTAIMALLHPSGFATRLQRASAQRRQTPSPLRGLQEKANPTHALSSGLVWGMLFRSV